MEKEEEFFINRLWELGDLSYERYIPASTAFLGLSEQSIFHRMEHQMGHLNYRLEGGFPTAERVKLFFFPPDYGEDQKAAFILQQICFLHVMPASQKFAEDLTHRDFLGAVLNLGIDRGCIGDIIVSQKADAWVVCQRGIVDFLSDHLTKIRHTVVKSQMEDCLPQSFSQSAKSVRGSVASLRVDALICFVFHLSRSQAASLVKEEKVFIQGKAVRSGNEIVHEGQIVSLRGYGRFRLESLLGQTKKNRLYIEATIW